VFRRIKRELVNAQFHERRHGTDLTDVGCGDHSKESVGEIRMFV